MNNENQNNQEVVDSAVEDIAMEPVDFDAAALLDGALESETEALVDANAEDKTLPKIKGNSKRFRGANEGSVSGIVQSVSLNKSGSVEIIINYNPGRSDTPYRGQAYPTYATSSLFLRAAKPVVARIDKKALEVGSKVYITYHLVGNRKVVEGKSIYFLEGNVKNLSLLD